MRNTPAKHLAVLYGATLNKEELQKNHFDYSVTMDIPTFKKFKKSTTANRYVARVFDDFAVIFDLKIKG